MCKCKWVFVWESAVWIDWVCMCQWHFVHGDVCEELDSPFLSTNWNCRMWTYHVVGLALDRRGQSQSQTQWRNQRSWRGRLEQRGLIPCPTLGLNSFSLIDPALFFSLLFSQFCSKTFYLFLQVWDSCATHSYCWGDEEESLSWKIGTGSKNRCTWRKQKEGKGSQVCLTGNCSELFRIYNACDSLESWLTCYSMLPGFHKVHLIPYQWMARGILSQ